MASLAVWEAYVNDQILGSGYATVGAILSKENGDVQAARRLDPPKSKPWWSCCTSRDEGTEPSTSTISSHALVGEETKEQLQAWATMKDPAAAVKNGLTKLTLNGDSYMATSCDIDSDIPTLCFTGAEKCGAILCLSEQCIVIGIHDDKATHGDCRTAVFNLARYLKDNSN